jgi:hypothetical protein
MYLMRELAIIKIINSDLQIFPTKKNKIANQFFNLKQFLFFIKIYVNIKFFKIKTFEKLLI